MATKEKKPRKAKPLAPVEHITGGEAAAGDAPTGEASAPGELPIGEGPGVSHVKIPALVKAINQYEGVKDARVAATTKEVEAKGALFATLHAHRAELPTNGDGLHFYTHDGGDGPIHYILKESLKRKAADSDGDED